MSGIKLNTEGLDKAIRALKGSSSSKLPTARVGILEVTNHRKDGLSNAEIGTIHEFGNSSHPQRSFLRIPLKDNLDTYLEKSGAFGEDSLKKVIAEGSISTWMKKIAIVAVNVVQDGFASGGFGKWAPWKKGYTSKTGQILVDTTQLRDAITYDVKS